jgi:hypothetical protein
MTIIQPKRVRPAAECLSTGVVTGAGSLWLDPPGSFG